MYQCRKKTRQNTDTEYLPFDGLWHFHTRSTAFPPLIYCCYDNQPCVRSPLFYYGVKRLSSCEFPAIDYYYGIRSICALREREEMNEIIVQAYRNPRMCWR
ncbi:hypothetical protein AVEN_226747-1 [Araneus ventricosus]|uniref:Uncharacterized protein n=1 Tax=Araneus ventricosus TaxID=182803 RepID=A0A4Y2GF78_ARAVE|nr:hypothetical protein AVEN_226747-1 [Araneus ventricosus]